MVKRSESGHGLTWAAVLLGLLAFAGPPLLGLALTAVAVWRSSAPWWLVLPAGLVFTGAFSGVVWRVITEVAR